MSILSKRLKISINSAMINKNEAGNLRLFVDCWTNTELTPSRWRPRCGSRVLCTALALPGKGESRADLAS
jgi:hypothetical protein